MNILIFGILDWDDRVQRPQQIPKKLAVLGHNVYYFNPRTYAANTLPYTFMHEEQNVRVFKLSSKPFYDTPYTERLTISQAINLANNIKTFIEENHISNPKAIIQLPFWWDALKRVPGLEIFYDCMDEHSGFETHSIELENVEKMLTKNCSKIFVSSQYLEKKFSEYRPVLVRNGCDSSEFIQYDKTVELNNDIGYFGAIDVWFDVDLVNQIAANLPNFNIHLIGNINPIIKDKLMSLPNIILYGERRHSEIPNLAKSWSLALIPFKINDLTKATDPVKIYEYSALGIQTVSTRLPELSSTRENICHQVDNAEQAIDFIKNFKDKENDIQDRRQFAVKNDWLTKAKVIETNLKDSFKYSFVILNYNNALRAAVVVDSIIERYSKDHEIIIVDNDSSDDDKRLLKMIKKDHEFIKLIQNSENLGFSGGMNVGITESSGDYIILCNNDICFVMDAINPMRRALERNPKIAAVGPMSNNVGNEAFVRIRNPGDRNNLDRIKNQSLKRRNEIEKVNNLGFFCVMIPKEIFVQVGKLDESYGIGYFEDDDFCERMRSFGYELALCKDSFVFHSGSATFDKEEITFKNKQFQKNREIFESKWGSWSPHRHAKIQIEI